MVVKQTQTSLPQAPKVPSKPKPALARCIAGSLTAIAAALVTLSACAEGDLPSEPPVIAQQSVAAEGEAGVDLGFGSYLAGRFAYSSHDITSAAEFMRESLAGDPADRSLLLRTVTLMVADGRIDEAYALAPRLITADPSARIGHMLLVLHDFRDGKYDAALKGLKLVSADGVYVLLVPAIEAWLAVARGKPDEALEALEALSKRDAYAGFYRFQAALIADTIGQTKIADEHYKKTIEIVPSGSLRAVQAYGSFLERQGRRAEAKAVYDGYLAKNPDSLWLEGTLARFAKSELPAQTVISPVDGVAEALFDAASAVPQEAGNDAGLLYARMALHLRPNFDVARMLVGETLDGLGRTEEALAMYRSLQPGSAFAWTARLRIAAALSVLDRTEEAVTDLKLAMNERPTRADAPLTLGDVLRRADRFAEAAETYDAGLKRTAAIEKRHWSLYYARGIAYERTKQWQKAEADFLKALELQPDQPMVLNYLGYSWVEQRANLDKALQMIERAIELRPNDPYIIDSLGWALYQLGDYVGAVTNLEKSVELLSNDPIINDHLGDAYWKVGRKAEARFQWERSLVLKPDDDLAAKVRLKLSRGLTADASTTEATDKGTKTE
ncbi:MAG: tetratricopeptide repeat protein [Alphaproteobacteria bacterium]|nr:tetratricopeptide repeat protein [Alphaproteobacteria bacterium]